MNVRRGRPRKKEGKVFARGGILHFSVSIELPNGKKDWARHSSGKKVGDTPAERRRNWAEAEAERKKVQEAIDGMAKGKVDFGGEVTVALLAKHRFEERKGLGVATAEKEWQRLRDYMLPEIGHMEIAEVSDLDLEAAYSRITKKTYKRKRYLRRKTLKELHQDVGALFDNAIKRKLYFGPNPAHQVDRLYLQSSAEESDEERPSYTLLEMHRIITDPEITPFWRTFFAVEGLAMLRAGEVGALRLQAWKPEFEDMSQPEGHRTLGELRITRTIRGNAIRKETKTKVLRLIPVHPVLATLLRHHVEVTLPAMYGRPLEPEDLLFPHFRVAGKLKGKSLILRSQRALEVLQEQVLPRLGIEKKHQHALRRAGHSIMGDEGVDDRDRRAITHAPDFSNMQERYDKPAWRRLSEAVLKIRFPEQEPKKPTQPPSPSPSQPPSNVLPFPAVSRRSIAAASDYLPNSWHTPSERPEMHSETTTRGRGLEPITGARESGKNQEGPGRNGKKIPDFPEPPPWFQAPSGIPEQERCAEIPKNPPSREPLKLTWFARGLLAIIRDDGPHTTRDLMAVTGLSRKVVTNSVTELKAAGLIAKAGEVQRQGGGLPAGIWKAVG